METPANKIIDNITFLKSKLELTNTISLINNKNKKAKDIIIKPKIIP